MPVVREFKSKVFPFTRLRNELLSSEDDTNKEISDTIGDMSVTAAKSMLAKILDEKIRSG